MMEKYLQFGLAHWPLFVLCLVLVAAIIREERRHRLGGYRLSPEMVVEYINRKKVLVLDVRDPNHFQQGHLIGACSAALSELPTLSQKHKKYQKLPVILVDQDGRSADKAYRELCRQGFEQVYVLVGGMSAWLASGLPLSRR